MNNAMRLVFGLNVILFCISIYLVATTHCDLFSVSDDIMLTEIRTDICKIYPDFKDVPLYLSNKSYTMNKKKIYLCTKDENGSYYDKNMLIYVTLHELAHVLSPQYVINDNHDEQFTNVFNNLLDSATRAGIYDNTKPLIKNYCMY